MRLLCTREKKLALGQMRDLLPMLMILEALFLSHLIEEVILFFYYSSWFKFSKIHWNRIEMNWRNECNHYWYVGVSQTHAKAHIVGNTGQVTGVKTFNATIPLKAIESTLRHFGHLWANKDIVALLVNHAKKSPGSFPIKVFIIQVVVIIQFVKIFRQMKWTLKIFNMDKWIIRGNFLIILLLCSHHNWYNIIRQGISK